VEILKPREQVFIITEKEKFKNTNVYDVNQ
jgi:hypothetical protein